MYYGVERSGIVPDVIRTYSGTDYETDVGRYAWEARPYGPRYSAENALVNQQHFVRVIELRHEADAG